MDLATAAVSIGGAVLSGGGVTYLVGALRSRRTAPAEITTRINEAAMAQVDQLQERVREAESAAREARREADEAHTEMRAVRLEAAALAERLASLARWVHDPAMTLAQLRAMVPPPPAMNGRAS